MSKVLTVAWREFSQTVFRPIFIIAVLGLPILVLGVMAVAFLMVDLHQEPPLVGTIAVAESSGRVAEAAAIEFTEEAIRRDDERQQREQTEQALQDPMAGGMSGPSSMPIQRGEVRITFEGVAATDESTIAALKERVRSDDLIAAAVIRPVLLEVPSVPDDSGEQSVEDDAAATGHAPLPDFELFVGEDIDSDHVRLIEQRLGQAVVRVRVQDAGLDPEQALEMVKRPKPTTSRALAAGGESEESDFQQVGRMIVPMAFMTLIWIGAFTSGQHLMMSTIEEKSNRVMEVLLSAVSPMQLMTGKILGHGGVGLLIVALYSSVGVVALIVLAMFGQFISVLDLVYLAVYYFMAYFMVASMMAAVGSAVSDIREANTLVTPVMLILMVPLMLWMPISQSPNGIVAQIFSFVPPAIPFAMILRMAAEEPVPNWQIIGSIIWGYICVLGMIWGAAKIFRVGVLMYGKPPSPIELIKWMRYS